MIDNFPKQCRFKCHVLFYSRLNNFSAILIMFIYLRVWKGTTKKIVKLTRKIMQINHSFAHQTNVAKFAKCNF